MAIDCSALNTFLINRSYIDGYVPSQADFVVFDAVSSKPTSTHPHALRWYNHIASYLSVRASLPGIAKSLASYGISTSAQNKNDEDDSDDDSDIDMFGDDASDAIAAEEKRKADLAAAAAAAKAKKPKVIAKSSLVIDVKPWGSDTDMHELETAVRSVACEGLLWGTSKFEDVAFGIKKLQIVAVIEDDKVGTDFLEDEITGFEDLVQSMDIIAFNKI